MSATRTHPVGEVGPSPVWAVAALLGAWLGSSLSASGWPYGAVVLGALAAACLGLARQVGRGGTTRLLASALAVLGVVGLGAQGRVALAERGPVVAWAEAGGRAEVELRVVTEPRVTERGWWAVVRVHRVDDAADRQRAMVRGQDEPPVLWSRWTGEATARPLGHEGFEQYARDLHAAVAVAPTGPGQWRGPGWIGASTEWLRARVRATTGEHPRDGPGLVVGLVTGDTRLLSKGAQDRLREAGLSHLTAVSGSNVALVVAGALGLALLLPLGPTARHALVVGAVTWFAILTRFEPSVLRASVMVLVLGVAGLRRTVGEARHALAVAVLVLLLVDPMLGRSLGLLLSAGAAGGILLWSAAVGRRLAGLPKPVAAAVAVTVAAQFGVAPVLLAVEGEVGLADIPANLLAVPLAAVASLLGGVGASLAVVHPLLGAPLVALAALPASGILWVARSLAGRGGTVGLHQPLLVAACAAIAVWSVASREQTRRMAAVAAIVLFSAGLAPVRAPTPGTLVVTAIDVGQGDAILVAAPDGTRLLVDAGGDDRAATWLRRRGVDHLDLVVVTHPHLDHVGGMADVLDVVDVARLWHRTIPTELPEALALDHVAAQHAIVVAEPHTGQTATFGEVVVEVLAPARGRPYAWSDREANDSSIVLRVSWRGRRVLLTGDVERAAQAALLEHPEHLRAGLLKVPHHGGATSDPDFLRAVGARVAVVSAGRGNSYGHPTPEVLDVLDEAGVSVRRTDTDGTVAVEVPGDGTEVHDRQLSSVPGAIGGSAGGRARHSRHGRRRPPPPARVRGGHGRGPGRPSRRRGDGASRLGTRRPP